MRITQRQIAIGMIVSTLISLGTIVSIFLFLRYPIEKTAPPAIALVLASILFVFYLRGWRYSISAAVFAAALVVGLISPAPLFTMDTSIKLLITPAIALLLSRTRWVIIGFFMPLTLHIVRFLLKPNPLEVVYHFYVLLFLVALAMILARLSIDVALEEAEAKTQRLDEERAKTEAQAAQLSAANLQMQQQIDEQRRLIDLVATLETPVSHLADGVLFMPIMGSLDKDRVQRITQRILHEASQERSKLVILDIAGLSSLDAANAQDLLSIAHGLKLLGCKVAISGISSAVAMTLAGLDISLREIDTVSSPQEALVRYQRKHVVAHRLAGSTAAS